MPVRVIGVSHKSAPVEFREKVAFSPEQLNLALKALKTLPNAKEHLILSTCNRTEFFVNEEVRESDLIHWLSNLQEIPAETLQNHFYSYQDNDAISHILELACGLDSMMLGEPQILGQLKNALKLATQEKTTGTLLKRLMQHAFSTAKKIRTQTSIGNNPISVAYAAVKLSRQIFSHLENKTALLIGAGETIELVGKHLQTAGIGKIIIANRSIANAQALAESYKGMAITLQEISDYIADADIIISSTAAPLPIIGKGMIEAALKQRKHKPIFMVDLAVPRDIESEAGKLDDVYLYCVDDLQHVIDENLKSRKDAAEQAKQMIHYEVDSFNAWLRAQDKIALIKAYRDKITDIKTTTLERAKRELANGKNAEETLEFLAHTLTNKLAHDITQNMNKAAHAGDEALLEASSKLLRLDINTTDSLDNNPKTNTPEANVLEK